MTQKDFALKLLVDRSYLNRLLRGKKAPSPRLEQQIELLDQLEVTSEHTAKWVMRAGESKNDSAEAEDLRLLLRKRLELAIAAAGNDLDRLTWLSVQMQIHLVAPPEGIDAASRRERRPERAGQQPQRDPADEPIVKAAITAGHALARKKLSRYQTLVFPDEPEHKADPAKGA